MYDYIIASDESVFDAVATPSGILENINRYKIYVSSNFKFPFFWQIVENISVNFW